MARKSKSQERRRQDLIDAASDLFGKKGVDTTSVDEIVRQAGVAKGTFYLYFSSKDEILSGIVSHMLAGVFSYIDNLIAEQSLTAADKMIRINLYLRRLSAKNRDVTEKFHEPRNQLLHWRLEKESMKGLIPRYQKLIEQGIEEGVFSTPYPAEAAMAMLSLSATAFGHESSMESIVGNKDRYTAVMHIISAILGASPHLFDNWIEKGEKIHE